jgi:hypothetical protein
MVAYTGKQVEAIREIDKNLQIIACAGAGKTQVISARIVEILKQKKNDAVQDALASGILEIHVLGWAFEANVGEIKSQLESRGRDGRSGIMELSRHGEPGTEASGPLRQYQEWVPHDRHRIPTGGARCPGIRLRSIGP